MLGSSFQSSLCYSFFHFPSYLNHIFFVSVSIILLLSLSLFYHFPHPSPVLADLFRPPTLHDISEDKFEISASLAALNSAQKEPGKKQLKRRVRRRKEAEEASKHTEKQREEKDSYVHTKITNTRWNHLHNASSDSSTSDENAWALVRKRERAKMPKRMRKRTSSNTQQNGSSYKNTAEVVAVQTNREEKQEAALPEDRSLNCRRGKLSKWKETCHSLSSASSVEVRKSLGQCGKSKCKNNHKDPETSVNIRQDKTSKEESVSERVSGSDILSVPGNGVPAETGPAVTDAVQKRPVLYDGLSDDVSECRFVPNMKGIANCHELCRGAFFPP